MKALPQVVQGLSQPGLDGQLLPSLLVCLCSSLWDVFSSLLIILRHLLGFWGPQMRPGQPMAMVKHLNGLQQAMGRLK